MQKFLTSANLMHGFFEHLFFEGCLERLVALLDRALTTYRPVFPSPPLVRLTTVTAVVEVWRTTRRSRDRVSHRHH